MAATYTPTTTTKTEIRITRRKRHADGWRVWTRYEWQETGRNHLVAEEGEQKKLYCNTCDQPWCIGVIAVHEHKLGRLTATEEA